MAASEPGAPPPNPVKKDKSCCNFDYHYLVPNDFECGRQRAVDFWVLGRGLVDVSTAHGLPRIFLAKGAAGALIYQLQKLVATYTAFDLNVDIEIKTEREMPFPAVTICNMAPIKKANAVKNKALTDFLKVAMEEPIFNTGTVQKRDKFQKEDKIFTMVSSLNDEEKRNLGFTKEDMIVDCEYAGYDCFRNDFAEFYNTLHGNCFIFNSGWQKDKTLQRAFKTGRRYGLKIILNVVQDEYMQEIGESAGARVVVHSQSRMPFPEDEGILLYPGTLSSIGLRKVVADRAPLPHGNCTDATRKNTHRNVYEEIYPSVGYSIRACYKTCYQRWVISECSCADPYLPRYGVAFGNVNTSSCSSPTQVTCRNDVEAKYIKNELDCACPTPCDEELFTHDVSSAQWPSQTHTNQTLSRLKVSLMHTNPKLAVELNSTNYRKNLLKFEVFFEEFNYEKIKEVPAYEVTQFISDIGGTFGLWLGFSAITVVEFFEFLLDLCVLYCVGRKKQRKIAEYLQQREKMRTAPPSYNESEFAAGQFPQDEDDHWYEKKKPLTPMQENNWVAPKTTAGPTHS